ncbi:MAG: iron complex transport system substrate-binding protein [Paracoccaceae bacterium]|jgi:iron complex transport system substrate-binding protein
MKLNTFRLLLAMLLTPALASCGQDNAAIQASGASTVEATQRIVAMGGEISETLVRLGAESSIVAVDSTSTWPERLQQLPNVGYLRQLSAEGVLSLQPDLILASHDAGPEQILNRWRQLGIEVKQITTGPRIEQALSAITSIGDIVGKAEEARLLLAENQRALAALRTLPAKPRVLFLLSKVGNLPLVAGNTTKAHVMIETAYGHNVASSFAGYKPASGEAIVTLAPELILVASHGLASFGGIDALRNDPALRLTPAGRNGNIQVVDSQLMLSMGPRLGEAVTMLHAVFAHTLSVSSNSQIAQRNPL